MDNSVIFWVLLSATDCVVYRKTDSVGLLLLTAVGWFIRAIAAVVEAVAVSAGCPDAPPVKTLQLIITTFCKQHGY